MEQQHYDQQAEIRDQQTQTPETPKLDIFNKEAFGKAIETTDKKVTLLTKSKDWTQDQLSKLRYTAADSPATQEQIKQHEQALAVLQQKIQLVTDMRTEISTMYSYIHDVIFKNPDTSPTTATVDYANLTEFTPDLQHTAAITGEQMERYLQAPAAQPSPLPLKYEELFSTKHSGLDNYERTLTAYAQTIRLINEGHHTALREVEEIQQLANNPAALAERYPATTQQTPTTDERASLEQALGVGTTKLTSADRETLQRDLGLS